MRAGVIAEGGGNFFDPFFWSSWGQNYVYFLFVQILEDKNFDDSLKYFQMGKIVAKKKRSFFLIG